MCIIISEYISQTELFISWTVYLIVRYRAIRQLTNSVTRRFGDKAGRFGERLGRFGNTIGRFVDNFTNSVTRWFVNRQHCFYKWRFRLAHVIDVTKHRTGRTSAKYRSWILVKCVWCGAYYWFRLRKRTGYGFHAFLACILLLFLLIQCKISLYLGPVRMVRPVRCFVTPPCHCSVECSQHVL